MSLESQSRIFTKSNLIYIPLSITIAHTLNFIINSPLSTWQGFPPKLPDSIYLSTVTIPLLLFISLTFEPIRTRKRFYTLLFLTLIFISIPISFRNGNYPISLQSDLVNRSAFFGMKMLLFLKLNRTYNNPKNSKEFKSYLWTLFNWRFDSYIIQDPYFGFTYLYLYNNDWYSTACSYPTLNLPNCFDVDDYEVFQVIKK
jgi:hypothetical protein